jgi:hypothetical protein
LQLLFRGSRDGFSAPACHSQSNDLPEAGMRIFLVRDTDGSVFGGFSDVGWTPATSAGWKASKNAFLLSLSVRGSPWIVKCPLKASPNFSNAAICGTLDQFVRFGQGDLILASSCNANRASITSLGSIYENHGRTNLLTGGGNAF